MTNTSKTKRGSHKVIPTNELPERPTVRSGSRAETLITLLRRSEGATIEKMVEATGWLPHSVRGFLAGALKKRYRLSASSEQREGVRVYRVNGPAEQ